MTQITQQTTAVNYSATLLNANIRLLAPKLVCYQCELDTLIQSIETDEKCARAIILYANKRNTDTSTKINTANHAIVYLGLIETKQFMFVYLLINHETTNRAKLVQLLVRAKLTTDLFQTSGPLNKDIAFITAFLTGKEFLKIPKTETLFMLFKLNPDIRNAIRSLDFGLRKTLKQAVIVESKCNPKSIKRAQMPTEFVQMYQDAVYWANDLLAALD